MGWPARALNAVGRGFGELSKGFSSAQDGRRLMSAPRPSKASGRPDAGAGKGQLVDPMAIHSGQAMGFRERPSRLSYEWLRLMSYKVPLLAAVMLTRTNQVGAFARLPESDFDIGFQIRLRDGLRRDKGLSRAAEKQAAEIQDFVLYCGDISQDRLLVGDTFGPFCKKLTRDSLTYDQMNFQTVFRRRKTSHGSRVPYEMVAMPAHSIRMATPAKLDLMTAQLTRGDRGAELMQAGPDEPQYVQIYQGIPIAEFSARELSWGVRNPRSDLDVGGYGFSELEVLVNILSYLLNGETYNGRFFSQGTAIKGLLNFKGTIPERQLNEFRREWYALLTGVNNAFRTPITNAEGLEWIGLDRSNTDMEFSEWINYLIKVICSVFQIDPIELNFQFGNAGQKGGLNQASQEWKVRQSRARGLRPILTTLAELITKHVVMSFDPDFELIFVGLEDDDEKTHLELAKEYVSTVKTVDEVRKDMYGLKPLPDGKGDVILSPVYLQNAQQAAAAAQQAAGGGEADGQPPEDDQGSGSGFDAADFMGEDHTAEPPEAEAEPGQEGTPPDEQKPEPIQKTTRTFDYEL